MSHSTGILLCAVLFALAPTSQPATLKSSISAFSPDAPFWIMLQDLAASLANAKETAERPITVPGRDASTYLQILRDMDKSIKLIQQVAAGKKTLTGSECLSATLDFASATGQVLRHANDIIKRDSSRKPINDEEKYHATVQTLAAAQNAVLKAAVSNAKVSSPGQYLSIMLKFSKSLNRVQTVVASGDTSPECVAALKAVSESMSAILAQLN
ncbi:hypothetical protein RvY_10867-1 [Ramazzottius varieornatus]|uniref:Uncharacterized protein n=1 Tax=Ramazzottius varieornatus TaxID=947166 RepID=A0A1D1VE68_RAMVA|nr:hypothetical protein RvY_10867-1 [Ramazzottius varieornatus]